MNRENKLSRRSPGDGAIYQRADGRWVAALDLGIVQGKRKRVIRYASSEREAKQKLRKLQRQQEDGVNLTAAKMTVATYLERWLNLPLRKKKLAASTQKSYAEKTRLYIVPHIGSIKLDRLTAADVEGMITDLGETHLSKRTVQYTAVILRAALNRACKDGLVTSNVVKQVDLPRVPPYEARFLTVEEAKALLHEVDGHRLAPLYRVALSVGMRQGELLALTWDDVDFERGIIRVRKSKSGPRVIELSDGLVAELKRHQEALNCERLAQGARWQEHGLVFPSEVGTPLSARNLVRHYQQALENVGLRERKKPKKERDREAAHHGARQKEKKPSIRFHDLRHSCASFLLAMGQPMKLVSELLGHSQIRVTMDTYSHLLPGAQKEAVTAIDHLLE